MELTAATLTAPALTPAAPDLLSLILSPEATPVASTNSSAPIAQDFSALLTEMIGTGPIQVPALPQIPAVPELQQVSAQSVQPLPQSVQPPPQLVQPPPQLVQPLPQPVQLLPQPVQLLPQPVQLLPQPVQLLPQPVQLLPQPVQLLPQPMQLPPQPVAGQLELQPIEPPAFVELPSIPEIVVSEPKVEAPQRAPEAPESQKSPKVDDTQLTQLSFISLVPFMPFVANPAPAVENKIIKSDEPAPAQAPAPTELAAVPNPELERTFADVKKFELTVQHEIERPTEVKPQQAQPAPAEAPKQAFVTTDCIANVQQQQIPPRVMPIEKIAIEVKLPERGKSESSAPSSDTTTTAPAGHLSDAARQVEQIERAQAAHYVEIPAAPRLQVVRSVAMEVGDADSQVTIRIQERGGDVTMQLNAGSDPLHQDLQSSLGSLVRALKQEQVQVSNVEVSRKSPIGKVRRMKEAH